MKKDALRYHVLHPDSLIHTHESGLMNRNSIACICVTLIALTIMVPIGFNSSNSNTSNSSTSNSNNPNIQNIPAYEADTILVNLQDSASVKDLNALLPQLGYVATKQVSEDDIALGFVALKLAESTNVKEAEERIARENSEVIAAAQPNYYYQIASNNSLTSAKAGAETDLVTHVVTQATKLNDKYASLQWALNAMNVYGAWDIAKTSRTNTVAIIDNGFLTTHEDLKSNIVGIYNSVPGANKSDVSPIFGEHGTHVAGVVAAKANNKKGVAGISYNAGLLLIQAFEPCGEGCVANTKSIVNAYDYIFKNAAKYNIKVVNMSMAQAYDSYKIDDDDRALIAAVKKAYDQGILTVCATGNEAIAKGGAYLNFASDWLADYSINVIGAVQSDKSGKSYKRSSMSNFNMQNQKTKHLSAPSERVLSTILPRAGGEPYGFMNGTSVAAPCVAGVASLMFAANPWLTVGQARKILFSTARDIGSKGWDHETGYGLVNAHAAVKAASKKAVSSAKRFVPSTKITKVKALTRGFKVSWKKVNAKVGAPAGGKISAKASGYQLQYSLKENFAKAKNVTVKKVATTNKKIAKLKSGKKYWLHARTYCKISGRTYYSSWSAAKSVVVR